MFKRTFLKGAAAAGLLAAIAACAPMSEPDIVDKLKEERREYLRSYPGLDESIVTAI